jgi:hypothetical protein
MTERDDAYDHTRIPNTSSNSIWSSVFDVAKELGDIGFIIDLKSIDLVNCLGNNK